MTIVDVEIPAPTCPGIDKAIEGLEELRNQNSHLRMGVLHYRQLYTEAAALIEKMAEALRPFADGYKGREGWNDVAYIGGSNICNGDLRRARDILKELGQ